MSFVYCNLVMYSQLLQTSQWGPFGMTWSCDAS